MWGAALVDYSMSAKVRTFVLDLTVSGNVRNTFKSFDTEFSEIDMLSMLHPNSETESFITLCRPTAIEIGGSCEFCSCFIGRRSLQSLTKFLSWLTGLPCRA